MNEQSQGETPTNEPKPNDAGGKPAGADGSKAQPKGDEHGQKWPGGGKKGEDE